MHVAGLEQRVLEEGVAGLLRQLVRRTSRPPSRRAAGPAPGPCARCAEARTILTPRPRRAPAPARARSRRCPPAASSSMRSSEARPNGVFSAVACTSISSPAPGHDDVHVDLGAAVLDVGQVEQRLAVDDPHRDRRHRVGERRPRQRAVPDQLRKALAKRDVAAADRRAAGAAVGLDHVAVDPHRALAERARSRPPSAATGRPGAGSRPCGRPACRGSRRAACARRSSRGACRTRT